MNDPVIRPTDANPVGGREENGTPRESRRVEVQKMFAALSALIGDIGTHLNQLKVPPAAGTAPVDVASFAARLTGIQNEMDRLSVARFDDGVRDERPRAQRDEHLQHLANDLRTLGVIVPNPPTKAGNTREVVATPKVTPVINTEVDAELSARRKR